MIPPMTHDLGRYWDQPDREYILVDDHHAMMSVENLLLLQQYDSSVPSGTYEGKMWRTDRGNKKYLRWYGPSDKPDELLIHTREISVI